MFAFHQEMTIAGRKIGSDQPPLVIAELSGNHGGRLDQALKLLDDCAAAGVEMVKFQTYEAHTITLDSDKPAFVVKTDLWKDRRLFDLYQEAQTPYEWHKDLFNHARKLGLIPISAPFDTTAVDLLESMDCPAYKIASCEMGDFELLQKVASTGKPIILSTGAATMVEIEQSLAYLADTGARNVCLLHCISAYPTPAQNANLINIQAMAEKFNVITGFSDHTMGLTVPTAAVALGATVIEKHVRLTEDTTSIDSAFSLPSAEISALINACHESWQSLGTTRQHHFDIEHDSRRFRRSLYISHPMKKGDTFTPNNLRSVRPAGGMDTKYMPHIMGRQITCDSAAATPLSRQMINDWQECKNILITSAANKWPLITLWQQAAAAEGIKIITADMNPDCPAAQMAAQMKSDFVQLPADTDPEYLNQLLKIVKDHNIGLIIPTRDGELTALAHAKKALKQAGATLPLPAPDMLERCLDKITFYQHCQDHGFPVRQRLKADQITEYPVFARHRHSAGSRAALRIDTPEALNTLDQIDDYLIQPMITAEEYSCDILSDFSAKVQHVVVRKRCVTQDGESVISEVVDRPDLANIAKKCAESLNLVGHTLVQLFDNPDTGPELIEVNARYGGCSYLSVLAGLDSPRHLIHMMDGRYAPDTVFTRHTGLTSFKNNTHIHFATANAGSYCPEPLSLPAHQVCKEDTKK